MRMHDDEKEIQRIMLTAQIRQPRPPRRWEQHCVALQGPTKHTVDSRSVQAGWVQRDESRGFSTARVLSGVDW